MPPVKSRRAEYTESTRDAVLDAAADLFVRQGYPGTSLDEIAAAARVTKGAIYHHFVNKASLMTALIERVESNGTRRMRATFDEVAADQGSTAAGFAVIDEFLEQCSQPSYGTLVFREAPLALGWERWRACEEQYAVSIIEVVLLRLVEDRVIAGPVTGTLVSVIFGMLGTAGQLLAEAPEDDKAQIRDELRAVFGAFVAGLMIAA